MSAEQPGQRPWAMELDRRGIRELDEVLSRYLQRRTGSVEVARDLCQEVWLASRRYRGDASPKTFLFAIARRKVADHFRRAHRAPVRLSDDLSDPETERHGLEDPMDVVNRGQLRAALAGVKEPFRATLRLYLAGWSGPEIAATLGCSRNTVRSRLSRGRRALELAMGEPCPRLRCDGGC